MAEPAWLGSWGARGGRKKREREQEREKDEKRERERERERERCCRRAKEKPDAVSVSEVRSQYAISR